MTADFYADQYRRYATFCRNYGENRLFKIAGGANSEDYGWTETLMKKIPHWQMDGLSLHYYTTNWNNKGRATLSIAERVGNRLKNWNTNPISRLLRMVISSSFISLTDFPARWISPAVGKSRHPRRWRRVLFPEPEGPMMATHSLAFIWRFIPFRAGTARAPR